MKQINNLLKSTTVVGRGVLESALLFNEWQSERYTSPSKGAGLVNYLAFLAKVANLHYIILTAFKKYWPDTVAKFTSGTQDRFI